MKKSSIILLSGIVLFTACKKENSPIVPEQPKVNNPSVLANARITTEDLTGSVTVSSRGYLVISDSNAYAKYLNFLEDNSDVEIAAFHSSIGFSSQVGVPGDADNYIPPSEKMNGAYIFSKQGIVQIGDVIYRGVNSDGYFLAMPASSMNDETYAALVSKDFNSTVMCKLKTGGSYGENLEGFVLAHVGFSDPSTPPTPPQICERKITHIYSDGHGTYAIDESWYFMGIRYKHVITFYFP